jgi:glyoxylate/succinic semialdehyde reductase
LLISISKSVQVVFDKDGVLEQIGEGKGYVDMSTVDAATSCKISEVFPLVPFNKYKLM